MASGQGIASILFFGFSVSSFVAAGYTLLAKILCDYCHNASKNFIVLQTDIFLTLKDNILLRLPATTTTILNEVINAPFTKRN